MSSVPELRVRVCNDAGVRDNGRFVLYWMIAQRRLDWNFALQRAVDWARQLGKPLVVFEPLRCDYPWASDRIHRFVLDGMADNARRLQGTRVLYYPFVELEEGSGKGLLEALAAEAAVLVTDDYPAFFLPRMVTAAADRLAVWLEAVDSNGLLPLRAADKVYARAYDFRRFLQGVLGDHLLDAPRPHPLTGDPLPKMGKLPLQITRRWPPATVHLAEGPSLEDLPIDHDVAPVSYRGGAEAAAKTLQEFLQGRLPRYAEARNEPQEAVTSNLSPYLHFGHISAHRILAALAEQEDWSPQRLGLESSGSRRGWWGMSASAESFLDELVTWRELGFNMCSRRDDYDRYDSLPDWARQTLAEHADDRRQHLYDLQELAAARTHDRLWNAAQRQLLREGRIHNYLRMLWGKKILEWSPSPQTALDIMIELNNRYAVDGRDPNSYSGIFWVLGRYDRAWGPERPIFGKVRYMSSEATARKLRVADYIERYAE